MAFSWKKVAMVFAALKADGTTAAFTKINDDRELHVVNDKLESLLSSVTPGSIRDPNNETTTLPGSGGNYTGTFTDIRYYGSALILVISDVALASANIEWSDDGINKKAATLIGDTEMDLAETAGLFVYFSFVDQNRAGHYYRVNATADTTAPAIFETIAYLQRDAYQGAFTDQDAEINPQSRFLQTRNLIMGVNRFGLTRNARISETDALFTHDERLTVTQSGSLFVEGLTSHVNFIFSRDKGAEAITRLVKVSAAGSVTHDAVEGRAVFATSAVADEVAYYETDKTLRYDEAAHQLRFELTGMIPQWPLVGTEEILVGAGEDDGSEGVLNGIIHGFDATGYFTCRFKNGTEVVGSRVYSTAFNRNPLDADDAANLFRAGGVSQAIDMTQNNYFLGFFEWLGIAPPTYGIQIPAGEPITTHIEETPNNQPGTTIPEPNVPIFIRIKNDSTSPRVLEYHCGSIRGGTHESKTVVTGLDSNLDYNDQRISSVHNAHSITKTLTANEVVDFGDPIAVQGFAQASITILSDVDSDTSGIGFLYSHDGVRYFRANSSFTHKGVAEGRKTEDGLAGVRFFQIGLGGIKYFLPYYKNGAAPASDFSYQVTYLTTPTLTTIRRIADDLDPDSSSTAVVAVLAGEPLDENLESDPTAAYPRVPTVPGGGLLTANPWREVFRDTFEESGNLVSGAYPTYDPVNPIVAANVIDTGWINSTRFQNQFLNTIFNISGVEAYVFNASDTLGNNSTFFGFGIPQYTSIAGFPDTVGAPFFGRYFRAIFVNNSGTTCTGYAVRSMGSDSPVGGILQSLSAPIRGFFPATVTQTVIKAESEIEADLFEVIKEDGKGRILTNLGSQFSRLLGRQAENDETLLTDVEEADGKVTRTVTDGVATIASTSFTSATANFTAERDEKAFLVATGVPSNTYITAVVSPTEVTLSAPATISGTGLSTEIFRYAQAIAKAPNGSLWSDPVWNVVLIEYSQTLNPMKFEFREGIKYTERYEGWY